MVLEFMDNIKNDHYYLEKIKKDIAFIVIHMKNVDLQELNEIEYDIYNDINCIGTQYS